MRSLPFAIGLHGTRSVGKDTLCRLLTVLDSRYHRYAFADGLKADLAPFIQQHFGFDIWTCNAEQKEIVRPILIAYGCAQRAVNLDHWAARIVQQIRGDGFDQGLFVPVITDVRFPSEEALLRGAFGTQFRLIDVTRKGAPPPTEEEEKHYREMETLADYHLDWGDDTPEKQLAYAREVSAWLDHQGL